MCDTFLPSFHSAPKSRCTGFAAKLHGHRQVDARPRWFLVQDKPIQPAGRAQPEGFSDTGYVHGQVNAFSSAFLFCGAALLRNFFMKWARGEG